MAYPHPDLQMSQTAWLRARALPLERALRQATLAAATATAPLPTVRGLEPGLLARLAWRMVVERGPWCPLVQLGAELDDASVEIAARGAVGGYLFLAGPLRPSLSPPEGVAVWIAGGEHVEVGADVVAAVRRLDLLHDVASDPTLERQRVALHAHARRADVVLVRGPAGSGRSELARLCHAWLGEGPIASIGPDGAALVEPGRWLLVHDLDRVSRDALGPLLRRLEPASPPPAHDRDPPGPRPTHPAFAALIGDSASFVATLRQAERHARAAHPVLILGETGTGKDPLARAIHDASGRAGRFVAVDLSSRASTLIADDLFGRVRGAFDGAQDTREGAFRAAHKGTLFLDEIGNLSLELQAKLLRVLERQEVQPLGSDRVFELDVRVIAATNADLESMVRAGTFRADLLYRLGVVLRLPPLRERGDDVLRLARHFLGGAPLTAEAAAMLGDWRWPGNVRELRRAMDLAAVEAGGEAVGPEHLGPLLAPDAAPVFVTAPEEGHGPLRPREAQQLAAVQVLVPGLAARGRLAVRHALLCGLSGSAVHPAALRRLESWPWWGGRIELDRKLGALRTIRGVIDESVLLAVFPELADPPTHEPIVTLLHPTIRSDGEVVGLRSELCESAVVIGRVGAWADLPQDDPRAGPLRAWLERLVGSAGAGWLRFPHLPELSRVHVVLTRGRDGLLVHVAPGVGLLVQAGGVGGPLVPVPERAPVAIGAAGRVRVVREGEPYLDLLVFAGPGAVHDHARALIAPEPVAATRRGRRENQRMWALDADEIALLNGWIIAWMRSGERFASWLRRAARDCSGPACSRLQAWLLQSGHIGQSCRRLYEHPGNIALREDLGRRLRSEGLESEVDRLPKDIRAELPSLRLVPPEKGD